MDKKTLWLSLTLLSVLLLSGYTGVGSGVEETWVIPNQGHMIVESISDPESVDPAWAYDTASGQLILNVYETLVRFSYEKVDQFLPCLATEWMINQPPDAAAPEGTNSTWYFKIRENVWWQSPAYGWLTPEDVEYSFERLMVQDRSGGPAWMIYEHLLGCQHADMSWPEAPGNPIDMAVQRNDTHVWFNLVVSTIVPPIPGDVYGDRTVDALDAARTSLAYGFTSEDPEYDPNTDVNGDGETDIFDVIPVTTRYGLIVEPFMQILCQSWASIVCKAWCLDQGDWLGTWENWKSYHDPEISPLDVAGNVMMGTGPYALDFWTHGVEYSIVKFDNHWQGWPAPHCSGYLERATVKTVYEWGTRFADLMAGTADTVNVPTAYLPEIILNWPQKWPDYDEIYPEGIRCLPGIPTLAADAFFFTFDINPASPYVGTGSFPGGIPLDFFNDTRIRKAFAYSFNYTLFIEEMFWGEAEQPSSCVPEGIPYYNPANPTYSYEPDMAAALFQEASADPTSPAYGVWDIGFTMTITYNTGNVPRETIAMMFKENVEALFELGPDGLADTGDEAPGTASISTLAVPWPIYLGEMAGYPMYKSLMPLFITGKLVEYTDPHDFVHEFMHKYGHFSMFQGYDDPLVNALIEEGMATPDGPERQAIYEELQWLYYEDAPSVCLAQPYGRHWERDWVQGWHYNPLYGGSVSVGTGSTAPAAPVLYFYHLWKGIDADLNGDNIVDIVDAGILSAHWYDPPQVNESMYDRIADIYPELAPDGLVDTLDVALCYEQWHDQVASGYSGASMSSSLEYATEESSKFIEAELSSAAAPTIFVDPEKILNETLKTGTSFFVDINITYVTELMGYDFRITFNSSILNAVSVTVSEGYFFTDNAPAHRHVWHSKINNDTGFVRFALTPPLGTTLGWNSSGRLATIEFQVMGYGESLLEQKGFTKLGNSQGMEVAHTTLDGYFRNMISGDVNGDGIVDILDAGKISAHWYPGPPIGPLGYATKADINMDGEVDLFDAAIMSYHWLEEADP